MWCVCVVRVRVCVDVCVWLVNIRGARVECLVECVCVSDTLAVEYMTGDVCV